MSLIPAALVSCSLRKGARQAIEDPVTGNSVLVFNPRQQSWKEHFTWHGVQAVGLSAIGRATVSVLNLNRPTMLAIRSEEALLGWHPPPS